VGVILPPFSLDTNTINEYHISMNDLIQRAQTLAHEAHDAIEQKRKYTGEPYWVHTDAVAARVESVGLRPEGIAAAHLHDVIEDVFPIIPKYDIYLIAKEFGEDVANLVTALTDVYTKEAWPDLNRAKRKALERERIGKTSPEAKTIKLADLINNTESIVASDRDFAQIYLREKLELLPYLTEGHPALLNHAATQAIAACAAAGIQIPTLAP
jgi:(p)ppGpp synthase/HD superfamily hydrolase